MKLVLLDTHALIWFVDQPVNLSAVARTAIVDPANELFLSAASIWETAIKISVGKLTLSAPFPTFMPQAIADLNLRILPVTIDYSAMQVGLPFHHRDPFDRLIIAQAIVETVSIASNDPAFDAYPVTRLW